MNLRNRVALSILVVGVFGGATASSPATDGLPRCRPRPDGAVRVPDRVHFVGTALSDTVLAGPGTTIPVSLRMAVRQRPVYGQLVRVHVGGGEVGPELQEALARAGTDEIVAVPWSFHSNCEPAPWQESARWIEPGPEGLYKARLRPSEDWVGGRPTLDVFRAVLHPYPHGVAYRQAYYGTQGLRQGESLTPSEYFALYSILPTRAEVEQRDPGARERVREWETSHPELVGRYPAARIIADLDREFGADG